MGATVTVRGVELGAGRPEIIVPLTGAQEQAVLDQAAAAAGTVRTAGLAADSRIAMFFCWAI